MRRLFFSALILSSLMVGLNSCDKEAGPTGPQGPAGPAGPGGAAGAAGAAGATGAKGADGTRIWSGTGVPPGATGAINDFYLDTQTGILYGPKTTAAAWPATGTSLKGANGATGATGAAGTPGATGAAGTPGATGAAGTPGATGVAGATGAVGATGATGAAGTNGTNFLAGPSNPTTQGVNGDYYFNIATSTLYGPKTAGAWPTAGVDIGVTKTPRSFFLDISLDGKVRVGEAVNTFHDTTLVVDKANVIRSAYKFFDYDVRQIIGNYAGWWEANGREIMFIDEALEPARRYMIPARVGDLANTVGRRYIYTRDPANQAFIDAIRNVGRLAPNNYNWNTNPYWHATITPGANNVSAAPVSGLYPHIWPSPSIAAEFSGHPYVAGQNPPTNNDVTTAGGLRYGRSAPQLDLQNAPSVPAPAQVFTMSQELYDFLTADISNGTYNALCTWMYAEAYNYATNNRTAVVGDYVSFYPNWKKAGRTETGANWDYTLKKQINLNTGMIRIGTGSWAALNDDMTALGKAWTYARDSASVDFSFTYPAPTGYNPWATGTNSIGTLTLMSSTGNNIDHTSAGNYYPTYNSRPVNSTFNSYVDPWSTGTSSTVKTTPVPLGATNMNGAPGYIPVQNYYNTWLSLNNVGALVASPSPSGGPGVGFGSGPVNDYGRNNADGGAYELTPPTYTFGNWSHINGKLGYTTTHPTYGVTTVPAPSVDANYPWGGIVIRNGIIYVNYHIFSGGSQSRAATVFQNNPFVTYTPGSGYTSIFPKGYFSNSWTNNSYTAGPWPANQNKACQGAYYEGNFIPFVAERTDVLIKLKIQTQPSSAHTGIRATK